VTDLAILACAAEGAVAVVLGLLVLFTAPRIFRSLAPETAGKFFRGTAREHLGFVFVLALSATIARYQALQNPWRLVALDGATSALALAAWFTANAFDRARTMAMRAPGSGESVDGGAVLRTHRLLRLFLVVCAAAGATSITALLLASSLGA